MVSEQARAHILADLDSKLTSGEFYSRHAKDVINEVKKCVTTGAAIPKQIREQYVKLLANNAAQNRFGK